MLKITRAPEFTQKVTVSMPVNGGFQDATFTARFRALTISEASAFDTQTQEGSSDYLRAFFVGWDGVADDDGTPMPFNDANRDLLIDISFVRVAILSAYNAAMMGAKRGN